MTAEIIALPPRATAGSDYLPRLQACLYALEIQSSESGKKPPARRATAAKQGFPSPTFQK